MNENYTEPLQIYASCSMEAEYDRGKIISLDPEFLHIFSGTAEYQFPLKDLRSLSLESRIMLFPAILGGIVTPLSLLAAFNGVGHPWLMILLAFFGVIGLYFGLSGQQSVTVNARLKEYDFFVDSPHPFLGSFLGFANRVIGNPHLRQLFYLQLDYPEIQQFKNSGRFPVRKPVELHLESGLSRKGDHMQKIPVYLRDPLTLPVKITFEPSEGGELRPFLHTDLQWDWVETPVDWSD